MAKYKVLDDFYKGNDWLTTRAAFIAGRIQRDGQLICDMCDKGIYQSNDMTVHHIEELTPDNVNDAMISLNPENFQLVHSACHNKHHKRGAHVADRVRKVYLVYGPPLAGKKTWVADKAWQGDLIVDMDMLYQAVSGLGMYNKPETLLQNVRAMHTVLLDNIKTRRGRWDNAYIIGGYTDRYQRERLAKDLGAELIYIEATREQCIERLKHDPDRRRREKEWMGYIDKWFDAYTV